MTEGPLTGVLVLDLTRMLPGGVLARLLMDLGARVIKVEGGSGDLMRGIAPLVDGTGAGFAALLAGAESVCLDLSSEAGAEALRHLAGRADVVVESFRPGTMERWGLGYERLAEENPGLVQCSLSSYGSEGPAAHRVGHDLNFAAESGLLSLLPGEGIPGVQMVDVAGALLASSAILAALVARGRTGRGARLEQPLAAAALPFLAWVRADRRAGGEAAREPMLGGGIPAYRRYACADGRELALGALEPKFWLAFLDLVGLPDLARDGLDPGERGARAMRAVEARLREHPREHWLALAAGRDLPLSPVSSPAEAAEDPYYGVPRRFLGGLPAAGEPPPAPRVGQHTLSVLAGLGVPRGTLERLGR